MVCTVQYEHTQLVIASCLASLDLLDFIYQFTELKKTIKNFAKLYMQSFHQFAIFQSFFAIFLYPYAHRNACPFLEQSNMTRISLGVISENVSESWNSV